MIAELRRFGLQQDEEHHHKSPLRLMASRAARRLGFRYYDMYYVERSLEKPIDAPPSRLALDISTATRADQEEILRLREARHARRLRFRFESRRTRCYVAKHQNALVGYSMISTGLMDITGLDAVELPIRQMPDDTGLTHDAFVLPTFRGNRIFHSLLGHAYRERREEGLVRVCNLIDPANVWSLKVHLDMGNKIQRLKLLKLPAGGLRVVGQDFAFGHLDG